MCHLFLTIILCTFALIILNVSAENWQTPCDGGKSNKISVYRFQSEPNTWKGKVELTGYTRSQAIKLEIQLSAPAKVKIVGDSQPVATIQNSHIVFLPKPSTPRQTLIFNVMGTSDDFPNIVSVVFNGVKNICPNPIQV